MPLLLPIILGGGAYLGYQARGRVDQTADSLKTVGMYAAAALVLYLIVRK